ncbi:MAG: acyl-CoA dehydrogenase family protein [Bacteroidetes bacterium]|nr:acyl-CoA dehydrogenase family protein [Bacteroidota bacterium]
MKFPFTEEQLMLRDMARDFTNAEIRPLAASIDRNEAIPEHLMKKLGEVGLLGTAIPEEYGGGGFGKVGFCIAQEEVARVCGSTAATIGAHQSIGAQAILLGGSEELKKKYLPRIASGEMIAAFALTEADAGSDSFNLSTRAEKKGDTWILNGEKVWITNGAIADVFSVFARTEKGITGFVVEKKFGGVSVGKNEKKLGIKGSVTNTIAFDNVEVPAENIIGVDGRGFLVAMETLNSGRLGLGAACFGAAKEMLEISVQYSKQRKQFGEPISKFQAIQFMLSDMATRIYAMENMVYKAAFKHDNHEDITLDAAIVKLFCSEAVSEIADQALQIHGGMGFSAELPLERFYRDARILKIFEGTNEIQKLIISRQVLKQNGKWNS